MKLKKLDKLDDFKEKDDMLKSSKVPPKKLNKKKSERKR